MKIQEFRDKIRAADRAALEKIASDLYRRIPRKTKEEDLDEAIEAMLRGGDAPKASARNAAMPFPELEREIQTFLSHVDANYYFEPNKVVPKAQRSKWRFTVMRFLKQLDAIPADDENAEAAARLYLQIYNRLTYACGYYIFPTEDPFRAIGRQQTDFYPIMAAKYFATGFTDEKILDMLRAATCTMLDRESLHCELEKAFIKELRTRDMRERAYALAKAEALRIETKESPKSRRAHEDYDTLEKIREISCTVLGLGIALYEEDDAIRFFMEHHWERNPEVKLYVALDCIKYFGGAKDFWLKTYEKAVGQGIQPRDRLRQEYERRKKA